MPILTGPPKIKTNSELILSWARWQALRQGKGENPEWAGFTCIKCPQQWPNHIADYYDENGEEIHEWINTIRCTICKSKQNKHERFEKWFEDLYFLALRTKRDFCFIAITKNTSQYRNTDPNEIVDEAIDEIKYMKTVFGRMLREDKIWLNYNSGLIVGELKWRRPGSPVYKTGKQEFFLADTPDNLPTSGMEIWSRIPMRMTEGYEAHPHLHYVGLIPKRNVDNYNHSNKMPYDELISSCNKKNMGCYIEQVPIWRAQRYLKRYLYKDEATDSSGKKHRIRDRVGQMRGIQK